MQFIKLENAFELDRLKAVLEIRWNYVQTISKQRVIHKQFIDKKTFDCVIYFIVQKPLIVETHTVCKYLF